MKASRLFPAISLIFSIGSAFAQQQEFVQPDAGFTSTLSRQQVNAEVSHARAEGKLNLHDWEYPHVEAPSGMTRAEVRTEFQQARADGTLTEREAEYPIVQAADGKTRAQVKTELAEYKKSHPDEHINSGVFGG